MVFDESIRKKQLDIIGSVFDVNKDIDGEYEAHKLLCDTLRKLKEENNLDNFNITTYIKDNNKTKWKRNRAKRNEFVKIFTYEIDNARESYGLTRSEVLFLYALSSLLLWEENLLVDEEGLPLNQKRLYQLLEMDRKTVYKNMKGLEEKKCLIRIWDGRDVYYLINPYLMFKGENINKAIPKLFDIIGYEYKSDNDTATDE